MEIVPESLRDPRIHTGVVDVADGFTFEVDQCGDGDELALCLHGFPEHSFSWRYQLPALAELGFTAWAPNLRGYGASSRPQDLQAYRLDELVEDVARLIEASGKSKVTLIAHDWGANCLAVCPTATIATAAPNHLQRAASLGHAGRLWLDANAQELVHIFFPAALVARIRPEL